MFLRLRKLLSICLFFFSIASLNATSDTHHIASYTHQRKHKQDEAKNERISNFEGLSLVNENSIATEQKMPTRISLPTYAPDENELENNHTATLQTNVSTSVLHRVKQSIPVLEPVKHLLNTVREGALNTSSHGTNSVTPSHHNSPSRHHHQLLANVSNTNAGAGAEHHSSAAIETEEEREMVNQSTGLQFLEILGTLGSIIWNFLTNIQSFLAAGSASASAASSR